MKASPYATPPRTSRKLLCEVLVCFLHPAAVVLAWVNLLFRRDLSRNARLAWAVLVLIPVVPFVYVLTGHDLW